MKKDMVKIQITQILFVLSILTIALLENKNILRSNLMGFYIVTILISWLLINTISIIKMIKKDRKKYYKEQKKFFINLIFLSIELLLLGFLCYGIDNRVDKIEFSKHCKETEAFIYDVAKDISYTTLYENGQDKSSNREYMCTIAYTYYFSYYAENNVYNSYFIEHETSNYESTMASAKYRAESIKPEFTKNDTFTLYYNTNNPNDWRLSITYAPDLMIKILTFIVIGFQLFCLGKTLKEYNKDKKDIINQDEGRIKSQDKKDTIIQYEKNIINQNEKNNINKGETDKYELIQFKKIERIIGYELPKEFKTFYLNGILKIKNIDFLTLDEIMSEISCLQGDDENDDDLKSIPDDAIIKKRYIKDRVPFIADYGGNFIGIDYNPGKNGTIGQIINYGRDEYEMTVLANSFQDFIDGINKVEFDTEVYITDYLLKNNINFRKKASAKISPAKLTVTKLEENVMDKEKINKYSNIVNVNNDLIKEIADIMEGLNDELNKNSNVLRSTKNYEYSGYRIKNIRDSLSRTMDNKENFFNKLKDYPKDTIKGYTFNIKYEIEELGDERTLKHGEEYLYVNIEIKGNVDVKYVETIGNSNFQKAYDDICKIIKRQEINQ